jgi:hypothetical protein
MNSMGFLLAISARPLGSRRHRLEDNIRMDFRDIVWGGVDWIHLAQVRNQ